MLDASLGIRVHSGWATAVAVSRRRSQLQVIARRRLELVESADHDARFVFHAAAELPGPAAVQHLALAREVAQRRAIREVGQLLAELRGAGYSVGAVGLPPGPSRPPAELSAVLRSHSLIHAAEGELFRGALAEACRKEGLAVVAVPAKERQAQAARVLGLPPGKVQALVSGLGRALGPPWAIDQKEAALAAILAGAGGAAH